MFRRIRLSRYTQRLLLLNVLALLTVSVCQAQVTICRDSFGVPSIEAKTLKDAMYGVGYVMAQDDAMLMARNYKLARGRLAEADGKTQLTQDGFIRSLGIEEIAEKKAKSLTGQHAELLAAFCAGANKSLAEQKAALPDWIEPFTLTDVLALAQMINIAFPLSDISRELLPGMGSNQFAVAPKRSANGHALLSIDPHLPWREPFLWYEFALYAPGLAFRGVTLAGMPYGSMGHNDRVAWCMTNNNPDLYDFFTVKTNPENANQYSYHGEWRDFEDATLEMRWREDGELKSRTQKTRRTAWGPMVPFRPQSVKIASLDSWAMLDQALAMMQAKDAGSLRKSLQKRGFSMWNIVYADVTGKIGYQYNAHLPRRDTAFDWSKPVPGDDPRTKWGELWTLDELPRAENPKSGLLVNGNSAPWLTPLGDEIPTNAWPRYVTSYGHTTRYDRLAELLSQDDKITVEEAKRYATDTRVPYARKTIALLPQTFPAPSGEDNSLAIAAEILKGWDGSANVDSVGTALYAAWLRADTRMGGLALKAEKGTVWTSEERGFALAALQKAAEELKRQYGKLQVPWGEVQISQRGQSSVPMGGFNVLAAAVMPTWGTFKDGKILCAGGSSFRMIVDLDPKGVKSWSILPYGTAQNPNSPHYADQMALYGKGQYKETHFGLKNARAAAKETVRLTP